MAKLTWDDAGKRLYETGVDRGVLYKYEGGKYTGGVAWNGLTGVTESPSGAEPTTLWADNMKYLTMRSAEEFGATITAYTYPDEFDAYNGRKSLTEGVVVGQQNRGTFGFCYRTINGNDEKGDDYGYKLHLLYGCTASPSESAYGTQSDSPEAIEFSWEITTTPVNIQKEGFKPTACIIIDSTKVTGTDDTERAATMKKIEDKLYGEGGDAEMPLPDEIITILAAGGD